MIPIKAAKRVIHGYRDAFMLSGQMGLSSSTLVCKRIRPSVVTSEKRRRNAPSKTNNQSDDINVASYI